MVRQGTGWKISPTSNNIERKTPFLTGLYVHACLSDY